MTQSDVLPSFALYRECIGAELIQSPASAEAEAGGDYTRYKCKWYSLIQFSLTEKEEHKINMLRLRTTLNKESLIIFPAGVI